jgi:hypothetical protein
MWSGPAAQHALSPSSKGYRVILLPECYGIAPKRMEVDDLGHARGVSGARAEGQKVLDCRNADTFRPSTSPWFMKPQRAPMACRVESRKTDMGPHPCTWLRLRLRPS